jgi:Uma2 family endonuclease
MSGALDDGLIMSREAYRTWAMAQPRGRFERIEGVVVAMAPERVRHAQVKALVWLRLREAVAAAGLACEVFPDGMTIETGESDYEPDAVLRCGPPLDGNRVDVPDPMVIVEVVSPDTRAIDLGPKLAGYMKVPTVRHYLIVWPDRPRLIHHSRRDETDAIESRIVTSGPIRLDPPGIAIDLEALYPA